MQAINQALTLICCRFYVIKLSYSAKLHKKGKLAFQWQASYALTNMLNYRICTLKKKKSLICLYVIM